MKNWTQLNILVWFFVLVAAACGHTKKNDRPQLEPPVGVPVVEPIATPVTPDIKVDVPAKTPGVVTRSYRLQKGFLTQQKPRPQLVSKIKNEKTPGYTTDTCWNYGEFSIVETKSTGEIGSAEVVVRYESTDNRKLCVSDFKGRVKGLRITEGHFAGVVGEFIFIEGDDLSEGLPEFQIFSIHTGEQVFRSSHNPREEFVVYEKDGHVSLQLFAKVKVSCELVADGEECWKKVLVANGVRRTTPMPDCKTAFTKANVGEFDLALVTMRAKIPDVKSPKIQFLGGKTTCAPAP